MVPILENRPERRISIREYGRPNLEFRAGLEAIGDFDVLLFTTSVQYLHLMEIASNPGLSGQVYQAMKSQTVAASVGPIMTAALR